MSPSLISWRAKNIQQLICESDSQAAEYFCFLQSLNASCCRFLSGEKSFYFKF